MKDIKEFVDLSIVLVAMVLITNGCGTPTPQIIEKVVTKEVPVEVTRVVEVEVITVATPELAVVESPFEEQWTSSGHADASAEAFIHWDENDPKEVPVACAKCHSTPGYLDFLGDDGSAAGVVDTAAPIGTVITCVACHNEATLAMDSVTFPSGVEVTDLGPEARCMVCHQGRESNVSVNEAIAEAGVADEDTVSADLGFKNIHYFPAAATRLGTVTMGGYQYEGRSYDARFAHVEGFDSCDQCHDPHTLEVRVDACSQCHTDVGGQEDLVNIRMKGSQVD